MNTPVLAWHFTDGMVLRGGTPLVVGQRYEVEPPLVIYQHGLHGSRRAFDALKYSPGSTVSRTLHDGEIVEGDDKLCSQYRTALWVADADAVLRRCARLFALDVVDKWDCPDIVRRWLETGDESIRSAAWSAAEGAARSAWGSAARSAAWSAAEGAARSAWGSAARSAAWSAAWSAAEGAARSNLNTILERELWTLAPEGYEDPT